MDYYELQYCTVNVLNCTMNVLYVRVLDCKCTCTGLYVHVHVLDCMYVYWTVCICTCTGLYVHVHAGSTQECEQ